MKEFIFRIAGRADLDWLDAMMRRTYDHMPDKALFCPDDRKFLERHLGSEGRIVAAYEKTAEICVKTTDTLRAPDILKPADFPAGDPVCGRAAAFLVVRFPGNAPDNLGIHKGLNPSEILRTAHMESLVVDEDFRGYGLQRRLTAQGEALAAQMGYRHSMCTVAPDNAWSLNNMLSMGYDIVATVPKYGGMLRHILYKAI